MATNEPEPDGKSTGVQGVKQCRDPNEKQAASQLTLAASFRRFADVGCPGEPVYQAICRLVAADSGLIELLNETPLERRRPNLWLAALHDCLLDKPDHRLASYFPSCGGRRAPDGELQDALRSFANQAQIGLRKRLRERSTQTNEIGRCAVLYPALQEIARRGQDRPLALLDLGCSAGLNLGVDAYRYDYGEFTLGAPDDADVPIIACELKGASRPDPALPPPRVARRLGIDPSSVDLHDEVDVRWLRACIWPSERTRALRFGQAVALARTQQWAVRRVADCTGAIERWLDDLPGNLQPVIFNSWVLAYFETTALERHIDTVVNLVRARGAIWLSAEDESIGVASATAESAGSSKTGGESELVWTLCSRSANTVQFEVLARSQGHGRWMRWLADS
jgi:hypothetical protein